MRHLRGRQLFLAAKSGLQPQSSRLVAFLLGREPGPRQNDGFPRRPGRNRGYGQAGGESLQIGRRYKAPVDFSQKVTKEILTEGNEGNEEVSPKPPGDPRNPPFRPFSLPNPFVSFVTF